jgi:lysyl-tRNA synthetase class 2
MRSIEFRCDTALFSTFPGLAVNAIRVSNMRKALADGQAAALLAQAIANCKVDPEKVPEDPFVAAWREAYGLMGVKPSKFRSSIEALLRRASKRAELALPIQLVNLYNACSIAHHAPLGAYDIARLPQAPLELRRARPASDRFNPLGAEASAFPLTAELVVYAAGDDVLCWGFNARDSQLSALTEESDEGIFFAEAINPAQQDRARAALEMLAQHFISWGAQCSAIASAGKHNPQFSL